MPKLLSLIIIIVLSTPYTAGAQAGPSWQEPKLVTKKQCLEADKILKIETDSLNRTLKAGRDSRKRMARRILDESQWALDDSLQKGLEAIKRSEWAEKNDFYIVFVRDCMEMGVL